MKPETALRGSIILFYLTALFTLLVIGPSWAYDLYTGHSVGSLSGANQMGDFIGSSNPIGGLWGSTGALVFGLGFLVMGGAELVAASWLRKSRQKGGRFGIILTPFGFLFGIGFVLPLLPPLYAIRTLFLAAGWKALRPDGKRNVVGLNASTGKAP